MSDFTHELWSYFIIAGTVLGVVFCLWLLLSVGRVPASASKSEDGTPGTTGHSWDEDLVELNHPLPRWWLWLFLITIAFSVVYLVLYPGLGKYAGAKGWTQVEQHAAEVQAAAEAVKPLYAKFDALSLEQLTGSEEALGIGERLFMNNCAQCHGSDGRGSKGFPNLTDNDWLYGGSLETIRESITKGRAGAMPPMAGALGDQESVKEVAHYVMSLSGSGGDSVQAAFGQKKFAVCAACHGPEGKGNPAIGAPNLTDKVWLHGFGLESIMETINKGRSGMMPAQEGKLSEAQIRVLAAYVWRLSQPAAAQPAATAPPATAATPGS